MTAAEGKNRGIESWLIFIDELGIMSGNGVGDAASGQFVKWDSAGSYVMAVHRDAASRIGARGALLTSLN